MTIPTNLQAAERHFTRACRLSRLWSSYVSRNIDRHGRRPGNHVSAVYSDAWPEYIQERLRKVARAVSCFTDAGYAARPKGVHRSTMTRLAKSIARRDGSGYYGPQP